jgi:hypothetical protein
MPLTAQDIQQMVKEMENDARLEAMQNNAILHCGDDGYECHQYGCSKCNPEHGQPIKIQAQHFAGLQRVCFYCAVVQPDTNTIKSPCINCGSNCIVWQPKKVQA